jgi:hypothetical protein
MELLCPLAEADRPDYRAVTELMRLEALSPQCVVCRVQGHLDGGRFRRMLRGAGAGARP